MTDRKTLEKIVRVQNGMLFAARMMLEFYRDIDDQNAIFMKGLHARSDTIDPKSMARATLERMDVLAAGLEQ